MSQMFDTIVDSHSAGTGTFGNFLQQTIYMYTIVQCHNCLQLASAPLYRFEM